MVETRTRNLLLGASLIIVVLAFSIFGGQLFQFAQGNERVPLDCSTVPECENYVDQQIAAGQFHPKVADFKNTIECNNECYILLPRQAPEGVEEL